MNYTVKYTPKGSQEETRFTYYPGDTLTIKPLSDGLFEIKTSDFIAEGSNISLKVNKEEDDIPGEVWQLFRNFNKKRAVKVPEEMFNWLYKLSTGLMPEPNKETQPAKNFKLQVCSVCGDTNQRGDVYVRWNILNGKSYCRRSTCAARYTRALELDGIGIPMPGDAVICLNSNDLVRHGTVGVLEGITGQPREEYVCCFNASAFMGKTFNSPEYVRCSHGPSMLIPISELKPAGHRTTSYWRWKTTPKPSGSETFEIRVPLWRWDREETKVINKEEMREYNKSQSKQEMQMEHVEG